MDAKKPKNKPLDTVLNILFSKYLKHVSDVSKITNGMINEGMIKSQSDIVNDHIAFRSLGVPLLGIQSLEKIFLPLGYTKKDYYYFEKKKLDAYWYSPPSPEYPRIFISELRVKDLSRQAQKILEKYTNQVTQDPSEKFDIENHDSIGHFFYSMHWDIPTLEDFEILSKESEYAAWVIYNQYYLNHYTISVHNLPDPYHNIEAFASFLVKDLNIQMNDSGGMIKTSADGLLRQCSSVAKKHLATFKNGEQLEISGSYVEFASRAILPEFANLPADQITVAHRRDGFETANADKIFESTYKNQTDQ